MPPPAPFARDYPTARNRFIDAARRAGAALATYDHPLSTAAQPLACDVASIGPDDAEALLLLVSGVHGVELYVGSACQVAWLDGGGADRLPRGVRAVLIHAINPWGALHYRRNNEDNVDLGRNFQDFGAALPANDDYAALHQALTLGDDDVLAGYVRTHGELAYVNAIMQGQFDFADGFGFGGHAPTWSNRTLRRVVAEAAGDAVRAAVLEYHSGLGPYGYGAIVNFQEGEDQLRARRGFGGWLVTPNAPGKRGHGHKASGVTTNAYRDSLPGVELTVGVVEYGTVEPQVSLPVMIADHRLTIAGGPASAHEAVRAQNLACHVPDDRDWECAVRDRSALAIAQALRVLAAA